MRVENKNEKYNDEISKLPLLKCCWVLNHVSAKALPHTRKDLMEFFVWSRGGYSFFGIAEIGVRNGGNHIWLIYTVDCMSARSTSYHWRNREPIRRAINYSSSPRKTRKFLKRRKTGHKKGASKRCDGTLNFFFLSLSLSL